MNNKEVRIIALLVLDTVFLLLEAIIGYTVNSLALVADAFHMLNDIISLLVALWAVKVKKLKPADGKYTYGWQRAEILGALVNAVFLLALCFTIVIEAIQRFFAPPEISSPRLVLVVGVAGLLSNGVGLLLFHEHGHSHGHGHSHSHDEEMGHSHAASHGAVTHSHSTTPSPSNALGISEYLPDNVVERYHEETPLVAKPKKKLMNMEGVWLHVLGDALGNIGVIITALFIWRTDYSWRFYLDPVVSLFITVLIFSSALPLCAKLCKILLQATPPDLNSNTIVEEIVVLPAIKLIHDFHVWNLSEDFLVALLHVELTDASNEFDKAAFVETVAQVRTILHKYGINSVTIQPEFGNKPPLSKKSSVYGASTTEVCMA